MSGRFQYREGDWNIICDRCGFKIKASQSKLEWDNLRVCKRCWEPRHPQEFARPLRDDQKVPFTRPEQEDEFV